MKASKRSVIRGGGFVWQWQPGKNWERRQKAKEAVAYRAKADQLHPELPDEDRAHIAHSMHNATRYLLGRPRAT